ncbi:MAG: FAD-binding oxidoreductase [Geodermatophilaceae bacterium]|nr:FAD-binding oxidoreductase [Geodermatophilaceae bacterium]
MARSSATARVLGQDGFVSADPVVVALAAIVGAEHVLVDADLRGSYEVDWTGRFHGTARAVVRPADTAQVAEVLAVCSQHGAAVIPQGGNTGLVGGSVPRDGEIVLSLLRLAGMGTVDALAAQVTAGAGATLSAVRSHVRACGLDVGIDFAARDSATLGGMVATNAGGEQVLRYGGMRRRAVGLEAVLADGTVLRRMSGLVKDNVGYDLPGLLTGSEGTLAVITAVRLQLVSPDRYRAVVLLGLPSLDALPRAVARARARVTGLTSAEFFLADGMRLVRAYRGLPAPLPDEHPAYLLLEAGGAADPVEMLEGIFGASSDVEDAAVATDAAGRAALWAYREVHAEAINASGVPTKLDVSVPPKVLAAFLSELPTLVSGVDVAARTVLFGHAAEGNVHVNVVGATDPHAVEEVVLRRVAAHGGSISAEHGVGTAKVRWTSLSRTAGDLAAMRAVKRALDPAGVLNPGVILPLEVRC